MRSEKEIIEVIKQLKYEAGSHSPSINVLLKTINEIELKVDACFLSNPYATDLFMKVFEEELVNRRELRKYLEFYPSQAPAIAKRLSPTLGVSSNNLFVGNGAIEIIQAVLHNFVKKKIIVNIPTFSPYYEFIREDCEIVYNRLLPEENFQLNLPELLDTVEKSRADSLVIINPNNPDGSFVKSSDLFSFLEEVRHLSLVLIDESFVHFASETDKSDLISFSSLVNYFPNVVVVKSMSKDFGIAGIRAGYGIMSENRRSKLLRNGHLWNVNGLCEYFFDLYSRKNFQDEYEKVRKQYINETQYLYEGLRKIDGIRVYPTQANFFLIEILGDLDSDTFVYLALIRFGVYMRTCSDKIGLGNKFIRVASRSKEENDVILKAIAGVVCKS